MRPFFILFLSLVSLSALCFETFTTQASIEIKAPPEVVFELAADTTNDYLWRDEVHQITASGPFEVGTKYLEDAALGIHKHYYTEVSLVELEQPFKAVYVTTKENPYYLKSSRMVKKISNNLTRLTYHVVIQKEMIQSITGLPLPAGLTSLVYSARMKKYLRKLRNVIESK